MPGSLAAVEMLLACGGKAFLSSLCFSAGEIIGNDLSGLLSADSIVFVFLVDLVALWILARMSIAIFI